jgi:hypothetical protein
MGSGEGLRKYNYRPGKSGYYGVVWHESAKKWAVQVRVEGGLRYIGLFDDKVEAALAYDREMVKEHGQAKNMCLNFPTAQPNNEQKPFDEMTHEELFGS